MNKRIIPNKALSYAAGKYRNDGGYTYGERNALEEGYAAGYRAALRDLRKELSGKFCDSPFGCVFSTVENFLKPRR